MAGPPRQWSISPRPGVLLAPNVAAVVARANGTAVSCAMLIQSGRAAGVYWVATSAAARNRGLGTLVTGAVVRLGFEYGAEVVVLQATELGALVYQKMGFTAFTDYQRFLLPFSPGDGLSS
ncbi:GNAT family N-acetyltransferase [Kribbella qitaiheensis]|uniref:GNAT family N-acetyltransferase n=1 Tax=Kribbella qitaiheensis TaxID=1544730 RepID=UPI00360CF528